MEIVEVLKGIGDETRIRILNIIRLGKLCVCDIENVLEIKQSNASKHLTRLKLLKIIEVEKKGQWSYYKINYQTLELYPFIKELIDHELDKIDQCVSDINRLKKYKESGVICEDPR
ncbi:ArsR/SmtB family transcription factor [Vallitalea okinawensis]|uniref:ArsR/SmtB family transcription factor n=1 Tax=Vallitalea okinawensis TaxID=2078660 RepID=UPI000CFDAAF3|nr:metalloregulator ArsR/SmtB family transcription factor [Vallitalea okinawensis]